MLNNLEKSFLWLMLFAFALGCHHAALEKQAVPKRIKLADVFGQLLYTDEVDGPDGLLVQTTHKITEWKEKPSKYMFAEAIIIKLQMMYEIEKNLHASPEEIWEWLYAGWKITKPNYLKEREEGLLKLSTENISRSDREILIQGIALLDKDIAIGLVLEKPFNEANYLDLVTLDPSADTVDSTASRIIREWKFNKAIYIEYGGKVCIPNLQEKSKFDPWHIPESLEATARWIRNLEKTGELVIYDNDLKEYLFEERYPLDAKDAIFPPENYFDYPPWHVDK